MSGQYSHTAGYLRVAAMSEGSQTLRKSQRAGKAAMSQQMSDQGQWLDRLFNDAFFQPDDALSTKTMQEGFSPDLQVKVNSSLLNFDKYTNMITEARAKSYFSIKSVRELLAAPADSQGVSHVAQESTFVAEDKKTGVKTESRNVALATICEKDGKRLLTALDEIMT